MTAEQTKLRAMLGNPGIQFDVATDWRMRAWAWAVRRYLAWTAALQ